eukprot:1196097-Prorocentrum_minimum.AAC.8
MGKILWHSRLSLTGTEANIEVENAFFAIARDIEHRLENSGDVAKPTSTPGGNSIKLGQRGQGGKETSKRKKLKAACC